MDFARRTTKHRPSTLKSGDIPAKKMGWIVKKNRTGILVTTWRRRYCVLEEGVINYYTNENGDGFKGSVSLTNADALTYEENTSEAAHVIFIEASVNNEKDLVMKVKTAEEADLWMDAINDHIHYKTQLALSKGKLNLDQIHESTEEDGNINDEFHIHMEHHGNGHEDNKNDKDQTKKTLRRKSTRDINLEKHIAAESELLDLAALSRGGNLQDSDKLKWTEEDFEPTPVYVIKVLSRENEKYFVNVCYFDLLSDPDEFVGSKRQQTLKVWMDSTPTGDGVRPTALIGPPKTAKDKKGNECITIDVCITSECADECNTDNPEMTSAFVERFSLDILFMVQLAHSVRLNPNFKTPKISGSYFGETIPNFVVNLPIYKGHKKWSLACTAADLVIKANGSSALRRSSILKNGGRDSSTRDSDHSVTDHADQAREQNSSDSHSVKEKDTSNKKMTGGGLGRLFRRVSGSSVFGSHKKHDADVPEVTPNDEREEKLLAGLEKVAQSAKVQQDIRKPLSTVQNIATRLKKNVVTSTSKKSVEVKFVPMSERRYIPYYIIANIGVNARQAPDRTVHCKPVTITKDNIIYACARYRARDRAEWLRIEQGWIMDKPHGNAVRPPTVEIKLQTDLSYCKVLAYHFPPIDTNSSIWNLMSKKRSFHTTFQIEVGFLPENKGKGIYGNKHCIWFINRTFQEIKDLETTLGVPETILNANFPADLDGDEELLAAPDVLAEFVHMTSHWLHSIVKYGPSVMENKSMETFFTPTKKDIEEVINPQLSGSDGLDQAWNDAMYKESEEVAKRYGSVDRLRESH
jgi:hypothetical protein